MKGRVVTLAMLVLLVGVAAWLLIGGSTKSWLAADCSVVSSRVVRADGPYGLHGAVIVMYRAEYQLRYSVAGKDYLIWTNAGWMDKDRHFVEGKVENLPQQCPAQVRYNPKNPAEAVASAR